MSHTLSLLHAQGGLHTEGAPISPPSQWPQPKEQQAEEEEEEEEVEQQPQPSQAQYRHPSIHAHMSHSSSASSSGASVIRSSSVSSSSSSSSATIVAAPAVVIPTAQSSISAMHRSNTINNGTKAEDTNLRRRVSSSSSSSPTVVASTPTVSTKPTSSQHVSSSSSIHDTLSISAITETAFSHSIDHLRGLTHYPFPPLQSSFDAFPGLNHHPSPTQTGQAQQAHMLSPHAASTTEQQVTPFSPHHRGRTQSVDIDPTNMNSETPSDILHYYAAFNIAKQQILLQTLTVVRAYVGLWYKLSVIARDRASKAKYNAKKESVLTTSGARHSTLAASYMSMVTQQQEQQAAILAAQQQKEQQLQAQQKENQLESTVEESDDVEADEEKQQQSKSTTNMPTSKPALGASDMQRAVATAHQAKLAKEAAEEALKRAEAEDAAYQLQISMRQARMEQDHAVVNPPGESPFIFLQTQNKTVPNVPLRIGIIGGGSMGSRIAEKILEEFCGVPKKDRNSGTSNEVRNLAPVVPNNSSGVRLFLSTRRPDSPALLSLIKRSGGSGGSQGTHNSGNSGGGSAGVGGMSSGGPCFTVYFDNARLITECNFIIIATLPHQLPNISSILRSLTPENAPCTQFFFNITSSHSDSALKKYLYPAQNFSRTEIMLPHLILKNSLSSLTSLERFLGNSIQGFKQSFQAQAAYTTWLGEDNIKKIVETCKKEMEQNIRHCFIKEEKNNSLTHLPHQRGASNGSAASSSAALSVPASSLNSNPNHGSFAKSPSQATAAASLSNRQQQQQRAASPPAVYSLAFSPTHANSSSSSSTSSISSASPSSSPISSSPAAALIPSVHTKLLPPARSSAVNIDHGLVPQQYAKTVSALPSLDQLKKKEQQLEEKKLDSFSSTSFVLTPTASIHSTTSYNHHLINPNNLSSMKQNQPSVPPSINFTKAERSNIFHSQF